MDLRPESNRPAETAGQQFVKSIRPLGAALFILVAILVTAICLTSGRDPIPGYKAPQSTEYYAENPEALAAELRENVFPALPEYKMTAEVTEDGSVLVTVDSEHYVKARAALLQYFDVSLITFQKTS